MTAPADHARRNAVRAHAFDSLSGLDLIGVMDRLDAQGMAWKLRVETQAGRLLYRGTVWEQCPGDSGYGRYNTRTSRRDALAGAYAWCVMQLVCGRIVGPQDEGEAVEGD